MCNLYSITTNQAAIVALFRVINRYVGNLPPMPGVFPDCPAPVVRNAGSESEMVLMRWGMPPPPRARRLSRHECIGRDQSCAERETGLLRKCAIRPTVRAQHPIFLTGNEFQQH
jgi:putative SOS response-associated peptidase YedK